MIHERQPTLFIHLPTLLPYPNTSILAFSELPHYDVTMKKTSEREEASRFGPITALKSEVVASICFQCSESFVHIFFEGVQGCEPNTATSSV